MSLYSLTAVRTRPKLTRLMAEWRRGIRGRNEAFEEADKIIDAALDELRMGKLIVLDAPVTLDGEFERKRKV